MPARLRALPIALALVALLVCAASASAETYTVTRTDDPLLTPCEPNDCSLRQAVMASNSSAAVDDVIVIPASASPYVTNYEELALPVNDEVVIRGAGADVVAIEGDAKNGLFQIATSKATIEGVTIRNSEGAIQNSANLTLRRVNIEHNEREGAGGGIQSNGPLTIESSYLGFNGTGGGSGGAIQANDPVTIVNSTLTGNFSMGNTAVGGNDPVTIASSAFVGNISSGPSGAAVSAVELSVRDSVFARNSNITGPRNCTSPAAIASLGGNVADDATCGTSATDKPNVDPLLGTLAVRGSLPVFDLLSGSPAIDAAGQCPPLDQRGVARPQGAACDSGPYEVEVTPVTLPLPAARLLMRLGKGRLILTKKNRVRVRVTCPADVPSPPCAGTVELRSPMLRTMVGGTRDSRPTPRYPTVRFKLEAGKTKALGIRVSKSIASYLRSGPKPRKVRVVVKARDAAGNASTLEARRKIVPAKRR